MNKLLSGLALASALLISTGLAAHDYKLGDIVVDHPWARASIGAAKAGAAYVMLQNLGSEPDRLIAAETGVAKRAELHTHTMQDGVMKMRKLEAIEVAPGEPTLLSPGGLHIMLMGLKVPLVEGETFSLTLTFEKAGPIEIEVVIDSATALDPHRDSGHTH